MESPGRVAERSVAREAGAEAPPTRQGAPQALPTHADRQQVGGLYFSVLGGRTLLTNDWGHYAWLSAAEFARFLGGKLEPQEALWKDLQGKGFIQDHLEFPELAKAYRLLNSFLWQGPSLHIMVVTLRCNHKCVYCHSSAVKTDRKDVDMSSETARAALGMIFKSPSRGIVIEFQGGEPLLNWPVVRLVIEEARARNRQAKKKLALALVSNLSLMDEEKLSFLLDHEVSLCTSLDGPQDLHDKNRVFLGGGSHQATVRWIRELVRRQKTEQGPRRRIFNPSALMTTTRYSLGRWREIVDEYIGLGLEDVFLRPLSPIGYAKRIWPKIGYTAQDFLEFYRQALDYIVRRNLEGADFAERTAVLFLTKILRKRDPGFVDLRSPCGAAVGQLAYNYDGKIYTCDEGRMVAHQGDNLFQVGSVQGKDFKELIASPACRVLCAASNLDTQPSCSRCVYKPYCGVCPVHNYEAQGSLWGQMPAGDYCAIHKGIFDCLFERLERTEYRQVFEGWLKERKEGARGDDDSA